MRLTYSQMRYILAIGVLSEKGAGIRASDVAAAEYSSVLWLVVTVGALLNIAIGVLSGCYLTRLATD
ncbi:MAG: hypothetical protein ACOX7P_06735, partial [Oscillospiraceae bacterium]